MNTLTIFDELKFKAAADNFTMVKSIETQEDKFFRVMLPSIIQLRNKGASIVQIKDMLKETMNIDISRNTISNYYSRFINKKYNSKYQELIVVKNTPAHINTITSEAGFDLAIINHEIYDYAITPKDLFALQPFSRLLAKRYMYWYYLRDSELLQGIEPNFFDDIKPNLENIENFFRNHYLKSHNLISRKSHHLISVKV